MKSTLVPDVTPESHPDHHVVGQDLMGWSQKHGRAVRFFCHSHDASGYNLVMRGDDEEHKNISERAVGRTFFVISDMGDGREVSAWGVVRIDKDGVERPPYQPTAQIEDAAE
jgi:hypothetical protein